MPSKNFQTRGENETYKSNNKVKIVCSLREITMKNYAEFKSKREYI
jgi:hypothetical protein